MKAHCEEQPKAMAWFLYKSLAKIDNIILYPVS